MGKTKACSKCRRNLPENLIHFFKRRNGFTARCKECLGTPFGIHKLNKNDCKDEEYKYCTVCREKLLKEFFSKDGNKLSCRCKKCQSERYAKYYVNNSEKVRVRAKINSSERHKHYYSNHKEEYKDGLRRRRKNNPDLYNSYSLKRLSLKRKLPSTLTVQEWQDSKMYFNNSCAFCGNEAPLEQEHFLALSKGGEYSKENIIPSCGPCNYSKNNKSFFSWYPTFKHYSKKREQKILKYLGYTNGIQQLSLL